MPTIGTSSKPAYVYDAGTDTWIPIGPGEHTHPYVEKSTLTTTGDLVYASAANTPARLGIGSTGQVLTVSGGVPAWSAASMPNFVGCVLYKTANQSLSSGTVTMVTWGEEVVDTDGFHSLVSNDQRITIPSGKAGKYLISVMVTYGSNATGFRQLGVRVNGTGLAALYETSALSGTETTQTFTMIYPLAVGEYIEARAYQNSGGNLNITASYSSFFSVQYLGA